MLFFGHLKDDALRTDEFAALLKFSDEDSKPSLYANMIISIKCYNRDCDMIIKPYTSYIWCFFTRGKLWSNFRWALFFVA